MWMWLLYSYCFLLLFILSSLLTLIPPSLLQLSLYSYPLHYIPKRLILIALQAVFSTQSIFKHQRWALPNMVSSCQKNHNVYKMWTVCRSWSSYYWYEWVIMYNVFVFLKFWTEIDTGMYLFIGWRMYVNILSYRDKCVSVCELLCKCAWVRACKHVSHKSTFNRV